MEATEAAKTKLIGYGFQVKPLYLLSNIVVYIYHYPPHLTSDKNIIFLIHSAYFFPPEGGEIFTKIYTLCLYILFPKIHFRSLLNKIKSKFLISLVILQAKNYRPHLGKTRATL